MAAAPLPGGFGATDRRWSLLAVAAAHVLAGWLLTRLDVVRDAVREAVPVVVVLLAADRPATARPVEIAPLPRPLPVATPPVNVPVPNIPAVTPAVVAPAAAVEASVSAPPAPPATTATPAITTAVPAPAPSPPPPQRKQVSPTAVRYLVEPPFEVPRAARRAGQHGTVLLRVVVSAQGLPVQVSVQRSSGYPRLDEQALWAMRQARFQPYTEDGRAIEVEALAPVEYPAE